MIPAPTYTIKVPTKTYLRKYVTVKHGLELNYNSTLGTLILCLLDKKTFNVNMNERDMASRLQYMNDHLLFKTPISTMFYKGLVLNNDKIIAINRFIESSFIEEMNMYCSQNVVQRSWRPGIDKCIASFANKYEIIIDEDISFDALKKAEYRYRRRLQEKDKRFVPPPNRPTSMLYFS